MDPDSLILTAAPAAISPAIIFQIVVLILLIVLSAFFSSAETAFSSANRIKMRSLAEEGNKTAALVIKILDSYSKLLSAILIGNNVVNLSASSLATTIAIALSEPLGIQASLMTGLATGILTVVVLLGGEIVPKTWANLNADKIVMVYAPIIRFLMVILTPVIFIVDKIRSFETDKMIVLSSIAIGLISLNHVVKAKFVTSGSISFKTLSHICVTCIKKTP